MERFSFETLPLGETGAGMGFESLESFEGFESGESFEDERGRMPLRGAMRARARSHPARRAPPPRPRLRPWPVGWVTVAAEPGCGCPGHDTAPAQDDNTAVDTSDPAAEAFEFETLEFESSAPVLRKGARGAAVSDLQRRLAAAGFSPGSIDGIFGNQTDAAVRAFQSARGLSADGVVGPLTWAALSGGSAPAPAPVPTGTAPRWVLPASVRTAGDAQTVRYDSPPAWAGNPGNCTGTFTSGAQVLRAHIQANFAGVTSIGGYSCRQNTANLAETSVHGVGRALDIMITPIGGQANAAAGDRIANWLVENAQSIGVQYVIWNRVRWSGSSAAGRKVADYGGPNPHVDHIHAEINLDAAAKRTPWFRGR